MATKKQSVNLRIDKDLYAAGKLLAEKNNRQIGNQMALVIDEGLAKLFADAGIEYTPKWAKG